VCQLSPAAVGWEACVSLRHCGACGLQATSTRLCELREACCSSPWCGASVRRCVPGARAGQQLSACPLAPPRGCVHSRCAWQPRGSLEVLCLPLWVWWLSAHAPGGVVGAVPLAPAAGAAGSLRIFRKVSPAIGQFPRPATSRRAVSALSCVDPGPVGPVEWGCGVGFAAGGLWASWEPVNALYFLEGL